jgi:hypothetical protein
VNKIITINNRGIKILRFANPGTLYCTQSAPITDANSVTLI